MTCKIDLPRNTLYLYQSIPAKNHAVDLTNSKWVRLTAMVNRLTTELATFSKQRSNLLRKANKLCIELGIECTVGPYGKHRAADLCIRYVDRNQFTRWVEGNKQLEEAIAQHFRDFLYD